MKRFVFFVLFVFSSAVGAQEAVQVGGTVNFCGSGGSEGMRVYMPGHNYVLYTDTSGKFLFHNVEFGSYRLNFAIEGNILNSVTIKVGRQNVNIGSVSFCNERKATKSTKENVARDKDKDGYSPPADCNDNDAAIRPGAIELCDGLDNNCNGSVDEGTGTMAVVKGSALCVSGHLRLKQCFKGFADCDGEIENGCETDLMSDSDHCGACGNSCGSDICALGSC